MFLGCCIAICIWTFIKIIKVQEYYNKLFAATFSVITIFLSWCSTNFIQQFSLYYKIKQIEAIKSEKDLTKALQAAKEYFFMKTEFI